MTLIKSISGLRGTIGGKVGECLTPLDVVIFTTAFGLWIKKKSNSKAKMVIGRDARLSGASFSALVSNTLLHLGIDVVDIDLSTTPTVEIAVVAEAAQGGIVITASHNPQGWNALKLLNSKGEFISHEEGEEVLSLTELSKLTYVSDTEIGEYSQNNTYIDYHIDCLLHHDLVDVDIIRKANFYVALDAVNSCGGIAVPNLLRKLGVKTHEIHCIPNGHFAHNPEPLPENITELCSIVREGDYQLGIVVDPDVDRLVLVDEKGTPFGEEYTLVAVAEYVLSRKEGGNTVSNLSSTRALKDITEKWGGNYFPSAVGEVNVVSKMKEVRAVIGGEGNGGIIDPHLHYGRDALIGIALFLTYLARSGKKASELRAGLPNYVMVKSKIEIPQQLDFNLFKQRIIALYQNEKITTEDGIRVDFEQAWVHLRKSNTEPIIRIISEANNEKSAQALVRDFTQLISKINK